MNGIEKIIEGVKATIQTIDEMESPRQSHLELRDNLKALLKDYESKKDKKDT